jgi:L-threonylcarbamoyladenylate synthase
VKTIKINYNKPRKQEIGLIAGFLQEGKVIAYPTDTIYGLGCKADDKKAINRIYKIKKREKNKPLLVLISDFKMLRQYFKVDKKQETYLRKIWPGKVSVILDKKELLPDSLSAKKSSLGVRLPKSEFLTKMIKEVGVPLVSTSLNPSGAEPLADVKNLASHFTENRIDLIIDAGKRKGKSSKLIDLRDLKNIKVLRK